MADKVIQLSVKVNAQTGELEVLGAKLKGAGDAAKQAGSSFTGLSSEATNLFKSFLPFATAGGIIAFFTSAVKGAEEGNEANKRLKFSLDTLGVSYDKNKEQISAWSNAIAQQTRFSDTEAVGTLEKLVRVTGDLGQAQSAAQLAMGLSVTSGKALSETTALVTDMVNGNERALIAARKEYGAFIGGAESTQQALDMLGSKFGDAALTEEGFSNSTAKLTNAFGQFKDQVGGALIPALTWLTESLGGVFTFIEKVSLSMATFGAEALVGFKALAEEVKAVFTLNFGEIAAIEKRANEERAAIEEEAAARAAEIENRKTQIVQTGSGARERIVAQESKATIKAKEDEVKSTQESAQKVLNIHLDLEKKIAALGVQGYKQKLAVLNAEMAIQRAKIVAEVKDEQQKQKLLEELQVYEFKSHQQLAKEEMKVKTALVLDTIDVSLQAINIVNDMDSEHGKAQINRAKAILALEKAIAIAKIISTSMGAGPAGWALAGAQIALVAAQFAQQFRAIDQASSGFNKVELRTSTDLGGGKQLDEILSKDLSSGSIPSSDFSASPIDIGGVGGGSSGSGGGSSSGAGAVAVAGAGGGINVVIMVGGVTVNFSTDHLDLSNAEVVLRRLADEVAKGTNEGIQFAVRTLNLANKFSNWAV